jgi:hypothetical protein
MSGAPSNGEDVGRRAGRHLWLGTVVGIVAGALIGWLIGSIAFEGARAIWGSVVASAIFMGGVGAFIGGISSLEPPRPGRELSSSAVDPLSNAARKGPQDGDGLVVEEPLERTEGGSSGGGGGAEGRSG